VYRAPLVYRVARPFRAGAHDYAVGDTIDAEDTHGLRLSVLISARYLLPDIDPHARRAYVERKEQANHETTIVPAVYVETGAASARYVTPQPQPETPSTPGPIEVPEGMTVQQTLDWAGNYIPRVQAALDYELEQTTPRSTLVNALNAILASG
jgi:hypothetical protein